VRLECQHLWRLEREVLLEGLEFGAFL